MMLSYFTLSFVYTHFVNIYFILSAPTVNISPGAELGQIKEQLVVSECRIRHLTGLLSEAERDLAKLTQQNQVLKEEIRRQQRSVEREQHAQNFEYLKNVILKVGIFEKLWKRSKILQSCSFQDTNTHVRTHRFKITRIYISFSSFHG